jgi:hypothetical protein
MSELDNIKDDALTKEERQEVRRAITRMDEIYPVFGPIAYLFNKARWFLGAVAIVIFLTSERGRAIIAAIGGHGQ